MLGQKETRARWKEENVSSASWSSHVDVDLVGTLELVPGLPTLGPSSYALSIFLIDHPDLLCSRTSMQETLGACFCLN